MANILPETDRGRANSQISLCTCNANSYPLLGCGSHTLNLSCTSYGEIVIICHLSNQLTHSHLLDWLKNPTFFASYL